MLRCIQTAQILFPGQEPVLCRELAEMDFGEFEYKNYRELNGDPRYQAYLDSGGTLGFPGGENPEDFKKRCLLGYHRMVEKARAEQRKTVAFVVHGGTIMAILEQYGIPEKPYFDWQVKNGACIGGQVADTGDLKIAVALPENIRYNRNGV
jgi:alpha-ribazole phosphatase